MKDRKEYYRRWKAEDRYISLIQPLIDYCRTYEEFTYQSILDEFRFQDLKKIHSWQREGIAL